ncbi:hypothetical protein [Litorihabitans aurantiacus]|uniref:Rhodanese-like domain-containing protein n=1 Tax=Litorihabitans aurantiacus TaxID=1930061 RepID=A0AA37UJ21_9MICO|nr:hypothetical protein GCM10025875_00620 [Litorihabitans aurantiacus]
MTDSASSDCRHDGGTHGYAGDLTPAEAWEALEQDGEAVLVDVRTPRSGSTPGCRT